MNYHARPAPSLQTWPQPALSSSREHYSPQEVVAQESYIDTVRDAKEPLKKSVLDTASKITFQTLRFTSANTSLPRFETAQCMVLRCTLA